VIPAVKVDYHPEIYAIEIMDYVKANFENSLILRNGKSIESVLYTKLIDWKYESEYRLVNGDEEKVYTLEDGKSIFKFEYDPIQIESIIFGCKMDLEKIYAIGKALKFKPKFKMAIQTIYGLKIVELESRNK